MFNAVPAVITTANNHDMVALTCDHVRLLAGCHYAITYGTLFTPMCHVTKQYSWYWSNSESMNGNE